MGALSGGTDGLRNISDCDDTRVMVNWLTAQPNSPGTVDIGAAGTAMRFSTALLSVTPGTHVITGTERMRHRPIGVLVEALRSFGADIEYVEEDGFPPLRIKGNAELEGGEVTLPGNVSSQYISALLMIGPVLRKGIRLVLTGQIVSRPYINLTLGMMREFGAEADWDGDASICVRPGKYTNPSYFVESDWSAASYWYEMVALAPSADATVVLPGLYERSLQGDSRVAAFFELLGVQTEWLGGSEGVRLSKSTTCADRFDVDLVHQPDLAQTFVVTCCLLGVPFHITGLQSLKIKETDRIEALKVELRKLGYAITDRNDSELLWNGERCEPMADPVIDTYEDHRMAMAFAPTALLLPQLKVNNPQVVSKSYPNYWQDLQKAGFTL